MKQATSFKIISQVTDSTFYDNNCNALWGMFHSREWNFEDGILNHERRKIRHCVYAFNQAFPQERSTAPSQFYKEVTILDRL